MAYTGGARSIYDVETLWISIPLMIGLSTFTHDHVDLKCPLTQSALLYRFIVAAITQGFYCSRVYSLTRSKCAAALIGMVRTDVVLVKNMLLSTNIWKAIVRTTYSINIGGDTRKECSPVYQPIYSQYNPDRRWGE